MIGGLSYESKRFYNKKNHQCDKIKGQIDKPKTVILS